MFDPSGDPKDIVECLLRAQDPLKELWQKREAELPAAIVATIKTIPGKRDEYLAVLKAHGKRCLATEPGTLQFEILVPQEEADTVMLYEVYASPEAFQTHWNGASLQQAKQEGAGLQVSLNGVHCNVVE